MAAKKRGYSERTKRHRTQFEGVYQRSAERVVGTPDIVFDISYKQDGKKIWEKIGWKSQGYSSELARRIRNERIIALQHGEDLPQQKKKAITFQVLAEKYLAWASENKNRKGIEDKSRYENHLKDRFDDKRLDEISPFDLERMKSEMTQAGLTPKTVSHCLGLLRAMFNRAADWDMYAGPNPVKRVKMPTVRNARDRFLSIEEADRLLTELEQNPRTKTPKKLDDPRLHDIALFSLHTGARASEIFNLRVQDVDFKNGLVALRDTKNKDTRYAPMTEPVRGMLKRRMLPAQAPDAFIFTDSSGGKIKEVSNAFQRAVERLGLNDGTKDARQRVVFHTLRHTFASWLAIQGTPIYTIAKLMGHRSISMSERYAHLSPDHKRDAVAALAALGDQKTIIEIEGRT
jgi:integrase